MQILFDTLEGLFDCTQLEQGNTLYVHLCSGEIVEVSPASAVRVTDTAVVVLFGDDVVAIFPRSDVYFAADGQIEPPSFE